MTIRQWLLIQPILEFLVSMIHIGKVTVQLLHCGILQEKTTILAKIMWTVSFISYCRATFS